jgi:hypothetical protein
MTPYFNVIDTLTTALKAEPFTNTVTFGDLDDVDLKKLTIFPLAHIIVNTASRLMAKLQRGTLYENKYQLGGSATLDPFVERFENKLAGWSMTFDILIPNDMTIC